MASSFDRLKELDLSRDEVNRIGEALKNQEFRKLLTDYVEEIQDPKNRQIYEEEVKQLERERGQEVTFLHPTPGYVIKTSVNGSQKGFINICSNKNINKPASTPTVKDGERGLQWSLPHSLSPPHEDVDNKGVRCQVYDVLFHPDTLHLATKNRDFYSMVNNVALNAVENNFNVSLDKKNLKFPRMTYKGLQRASIIRKPSKEKPTEHSADEQELLNKIFSEIDAQSNKHKKDSSPKKSKSRKNSIEDNITYTTPKFVIKHRTHLDIQDFTEHKNAKLNTTIPRELIVEINLPLLKSSSDIDLDVTEKTIELVSEKPAKYKLSLTLPYPVNEINGTAKFDKDLKKLLITLPVKIKCIEPMRDDSGVESCFESDLNSPQHESDDDDDSDEQRPISIISSSDNINQQKSDSVRDCDKLDGKISDTFLNPSDLYNLPEFTCNIFDNVVAFTFNVKNVDENTVSKLFSPEKSLTKVKFTSVSSSFYPSCYAFYVKFPQHNVIAENIIVETWDNNVILQIPLKASDQKLVSYFYGTGEENMVEKFVEEPAVISKIFEQSEVCVDERKLEVTEASKSDENAPIKFSESSSLTETAKEESKRDNKSIFTLKSNAIDIFATSYESSGDELSASSFSPKKSKGILKRTSNKRLNFGRSVSESSLDEFMCSSLENYHGSIECVPEDSREYDEMMSSSYKKTVRFNDVVSRQLFRSNSSILGQKKKNQRKSRNKKRANERRCSESETSDIENKKEGDNQTNSDQAENDNTVLHKTATDKKDDSDIFHLEINN